MVHRTYVDRLVLGRSAHDQLQEPWTDPPQTTNDEYVQCYDVRGHPVHTRSRRLGRDLRHAQNDILTTIGVCVCNKEQADQKDTPSTVPGPSKFEQDQARINLDEHVRSFWLEIGMGMALNVLPEWIRNIRRRVQTFDIYLDVPLWAIVRSEYHHNDLWSFLFAGKMPTYAFLLSPSIVAITLDLVSSWLPERLRFNGLSSTHQDVVQRITFIVLSPWYATLKLQQLGLVQDWYAPFKAQSIAFRNLRQGVRTTGGWGLIRGFAASPLLWGILYLGIVENVDRKIYTYMKAVFARPDNPSVVSYKLQSAGYDFDTAEAPVLTRPPIQPTLREEVSRDYRAILATAKAASDYVTSLFTRKQERDSRPQPRRGASEGPGQVVTFASEEVVEEVIMLDESPEPETDQYARASSTPLDSPPQSPVSSIEEVNPSAVQVRTRSGSTSTLHMDLEVHLPLSAQQSRSDARISSVEFTGPDGAPADATSNASRPPAHHRVTALTILPSDQIADVFSSLCCSVITISVESMFLRRAAFAFLSSNPNAPTWLRSSIYEPKWMGLGKYGWKGLATYSGQIALCYGVEAIVSLSTWHLGSWMVMWMGKRKFGWGHL